MTSHSTKRLLVGSSVLGLAIASMGLIGCGGEEPVVRTPRARATSSTPTAAPTTTRLMAVSDLIREMGIDDRVVLPEEKAPDSTAKRKAVLEFFDAFARGDNVIVSDMLTLADRYELEQLVESGEWASTTELITEVLIETGPSPHGIECALAIFEIGDTYQPQLWYYTEEGDGFIFEPVSSPPNIMNRLYGLNPIDVWHQILAEEEALANKPDEEVELVQVVVGTASNNNRGSGPRGDGPASLSPGLDSPIQSPGRGIPGPTPGG